MAIKAIQFGVNTFWPTMTRHMRFFLISPGLKCSLTDELAVNIQSAIILISLCFLFSFFFVNSFPVDNFFGQCTESD